MERSKKYKKNSQPKKIHNFYKSDAWKLCRAKVIVRENGLCKLCGKPGSEVHHKIHLTLSNIDDPNIALNPDNCELLCRECHNKEHHRFEGNKSPYEFDKNGDLIQVKNKNGPSP